MLIVFGPTDKGIAAEAVPEVTAVPFTIIEAAAAEAVGVTVIEVSPFATLAA